MVDRDGRELPIQPDIVGTRMTLEPYEHIKLIGPQQFKLVVGER